MFVVVTSEKSGDGVHRAVANVYGPFVLRPQAEAFRSKYCYEVVACVRPVMKERLAEKLEPQGERKKKDAQKRKHRSNDRRS